MRKHLASADPDVGKGLEYVALRAQTARVTMHVVIAKRIKKRRLVASYPLPAFRTARFREAAEDVMALAAAAFGAVTFRIRRYPGIQHRDIRHGTPVQAATAR